MRQHESQNDIYFIVLFLLYVSFFKYKPLDDLHFFILDIGWITLGYLCAVIKGDVISNMKEYHQ